jgi:hypothetical protein
MLMIQKKGKKSSKDTLLSKTPLIKDIRLNLFLNVLINYVRFIREYIVVHNKLLRFIKVGPGAEILIVSILYIFFRDLRTSYSAISELC